MSNQTTCYLEVDGQILTMEEIAQKFGIKHPINEVALCKTVEDGVLCAKTMPNEDEYPGIDVELQLAKDKESLPVMLSRSEQPHGGETKTYLYGRCDEYIAYAAADTRPDAEVEEFPKDATLVVSGNPGWTVIVEQENPYIRIRAFGEKEEEDLAF